VTIQHKSLPRVIMVDRPDVVINAIHEVVEAAQNHTNLKN
jgi:hypothetical protein